MGCWQDLDLELGYRILQYLPSNDLIVCQSVCKFVREAAISLYYNTVVIKEPKQATLFLEGQLQAVQPKGGLFVNILNITECFAMRVGNVLPPSAMILFADTCPNVQYLVGDARYSYFWNGLKEVHHSWKQLKSIPFQFDHAKEYISCFSRFSKTLTNVTIKDLPKDQFPDAKYEGRQVLAYIKALAPQAESLELFNRKLKYIYDLYYLPFFFPNLRHLVLNRGKPKYFMNATREILIEYKKKKPGQTLKHLELLYIGLPKLELDSIQFIESYFPSVKNFRLEFDKVANLLRYDNACLKTLLDYVLSREKYYVRLPVDAPAVLLDKYYQYFSSPDHSLTINYRPNLPQSSRRANETYCPDVIIQKQDKNGSASVQLDYFYFETFSENFLQLTDEVFRYSGDKLRLLDINMGLLNCQTVGSELMNGVFLDRYIFNYCTHLQALRLQYFHLVNCSQMVVQNNSVQSVYIVSSFIHAPQVFYALSLRLPNLKELCLEKCQLTLFDNFFYYIPLDKSNLERFTIADNMENSKVWVKWIILRSAMQGTMIYGRSEPNSPIFVEISLRHFENNLIPDDRRIVIACNSIKALEISSAQFHAKLEVKFM